MIDKLKNILNLSKLYIKENDLSLKIINMKTRRFNKKSVLFWVYVILFFGAFYVSSEVVEYTRKIGKPEIFLNGFLLFIEILVIIRTVVVSMNVFYFSKDMENVLHLPIKPIEILISKLNTLLFMNYELELIFAAVPLLNYGIYNNAQLSYFFNLILLLVLFPIFAVLVVSIIMIILMKTIKLFKNKDLMQFIVGFAFMFVLILFMNKALTYTFQNAEYINENQELVLNNINNNIVKINSYFLNIKPTAKILQEKGILKILFNYCKLLFINAIAFLIFIYLGNKLYLKQLLKANFYTKKKIKKQVKVNKKIKRKSISNAFITKEFKVLLKNPLFFMQTLYPIFINTLTVCVLVIALVPVINNALHMEENRELLEGLKFNLEAVCIILGAIQVVGLFNNSSITAFSRDGKSAYINKSLPVSLYKQFIYKNIPQIFINTISTIIILFVIVYKIPAIGIKYYFIIFGISLLLTIINSNILCLIDLLMPKLEWDAEYDILKNNKNKLFQYVLIILNILLLVFVNDAFEKHNLDKSLTIFATALGAIFIVFNILFKRYQTRLFNKIK